MNLQKTSAFLITFVAGACAWQLPATADELSELYLGSSSTGTSSIIPPNVLFIIDTSSSMDNTPGFWMDPVDYWGAYDPTIDYPGECGTAEDEYLFYDRVSNNDSTETYPDPTLDCTDTTRRIPKAAFVCNNTDVFSNGRDTLHLQYYRPLVTKPTDATRVYDNGNDFDGEWHALSVKDSYVASIWRDPDTLQLASTGSGEEMMLWRECVEDWGVHGINDNPATTTVDESATEVYPVEDGDPVVSYDKYTGGGNGNDGADGNYAGYSANSSHSEIVPKTESDWQQTYVWTANYINYHNWAQMRLSVVQAAIRDIVNSLPDSVNIGLMRFDANTNDGNGTEGGMMQKEFVRVGTGSNRQDFIDTVFSIKPWEGTGTPLAETLHEATLVFRGDRVIWGARSDYWAKDGSVVDFPSVPASRQSSNPSDADYHYYESPIAHECQDNSIIYLSDGAPSSDGSAWYGPGWFANDGVKDLPSINSITTTSCGDACMPIISEYLATIDQGVGVAGNQFVTTNTVGFGTGLSQTDEEYLIKTAEKGGGIYRKANSYDELKESFRIVVRNALAKNASLSSPAVTVNAFNRLAHRDELYFTMFDPSLDTTRWPGNVKKYRLVKRSDGEFRIVDANGNEALDGETSNMNPNALSFWTDTTDPWIVENLGVDGHVTTIGGAAGELTDSNLAARKLYSWFGDTANKGLTSSANSFDASNTGITNSMLGLPLFSTTSKADVINFMRGQDLKDEDGDGSMTDARRAMGAAPHGVPTIVTYGTDESTATQVIYAPTNDGFLHAIDASSGKELWAFIPTEVMPEFADMYNTPTNPHITYGLDAPIVRYVEGTGTGDRKWLFFGMRRGGKSIYALDVTDRTDPKILWRITNKNPDFGDLAQTWSDPAIARLKLGGTDSTGTPVLIFGGGFDETTQDSSTADDGYLDDSKGNAIYMVRADDGSLLWSAGLSSGHDSVLTDMRSSIAAQVVIKDKNDDGFHDLVYAADLGGRIWRFDIDNSSNTATSLSVTGGLIADLGGDGSSGNLDNRKFFNKPDVVLAARDGDVYWAINIGSGDRERPESNRHGTNGTGGTDNYLFSIKDTPVFTARNAYDATDVIGIDDLFDASTATGNNPKGWKVKLQHDGEKALAPATTFDYRVFFTTFDPTPVIESTCNPQPGRARLYTLDLLTAGAVRDRDNDGDFDADDREEDLPHGTIPPGVTVMFIDDGTGHVEVTGIVGRSNSKPDLGNGNVIRRTFWQIRGDSEEF